MRYCVIIFAFIFSNKAFGQNQTSEKISIYTSAQCNMCKSNIERKIGLSKGVKSVKLDIPTKNLEIIFNPKKTNAHELRNIISEIGYDADSVLANPSSYAKLPECCKKGGHN